MKVAFIDHSCFSYPYDHSLLNALCEDVDVTFFRSIFQYGKNFESRRYNELNFFYPISNYLRKKFPKLKYIFSPLKIIEHILCSIALIIYLKFKGYNIVHFQWFPVVQFDVLVVQILKSLGLKVYFTAHNVLPHERSSQYKKSYAVIYDLVDGVFVHSLDSIDKLYKVFNLDGSKVHKITHGNFSYLNDLTPKEYTNREKDYMNFCSTGESDVTLLSFGLIRPYKGLDDAIRVVASFKQRGIPVKLAVLGRFSNGSYRLEIKQLISDYDVDERVFILDEFVPEENICSLARLADIAFFPYREIDQSGAVLAMVSVGMPIVAANLGGLKEVVENKKNGYLVDGKLGLQGYEDAVQKVIVASAPLLAQESYDIAEKKFGWGSTANKIAEVYKNECS